MTVEAIYDLNLSNLSRLHSSKPTLKPTLETSPLAHTAKCQKNIEQFQLIKHTVLLLLYPLDLCTCISSVSKTLALLPYSLLCNTFYPLADLYSSLSLLLHFLQGKFSPLCFLNTTFPSPIMTLL